MGSVESHDKQKTVERPNLAVIHRPNRESWIQTAEERDRPSYRRDYHVAATHRHEAVTAGRYIVARLVLVVLFIVAYRVFGWPSVALMVAASLAYILAMLV
jgi:hypothetical protein